MSENFRFHTQANGIIFVRPFWEFAFGLEEKIMSVEAVRQACFQCHEVIAVPKRVQSVSSYIVPHTKEHAGSRLVACWEQG
jgi:hypothetical protein